MKKLVYGAFALAAIALSAIGCQKEVKKEQVQETNAVRLRVDIPTLTRATEAKVDASTTITVQSLGVIFYDASGNIQKSFNVNSTTAPSITDVTREAGARFEGVNASATKVLIVGNLPTTYLTVDNKDVLTGNTENLTLPTSGNISVFTKKLLSMATQSDINNVVLFSQPADLVVVGSTGNPSWYNHATTDKLNGDAAARAPEKSAKDKYVENAIQIKPAVARVQIEGITNKDGSKITAATLSGIYLNNIYTDFSIASVQATNPNGVTFLHLDAQSDKTKFTKNDGTTPEFPYVTALNNKYYDAPLTIALNSKKWQPNTNKVWAYQLAPNSDKEPDGKALQLHFNFTGIQPATLLDGKYGTGATAKGMWVSVKGLLDKTSNDKLSIEPGKVYTIEASQFVIDENSLVPNPITEGAVQVYLKATVQNWEVVLAKPNIVTQ